MSGTLRLFCALRLPAPVRACVAAWQGAALGGVRPVSVSNLHVTLAFLGRQPSAALGAIADTLGGLAAASGPIVLVPNGYRETRSVAMITLADEGGHAAALASALQEALAGAGLMARPERHGWLAHLTVARFHSRPGLQPRLPALGPISPSDAAVYSSVLRPDGARYEVLEARPLGG